MILDTSPAGEKKPPAPALTPPALTLIVPVYDEQDNLAPLTEEIRAALESQPLTWELLFVDDGSRDGSLRVMRELAAQHGFVRYLALEENRGQSAAFAAGFQEGRGDIFITLDADLQNDPADIPLMLRLLEQGYDMVIGWRAERCDSPVKRISSKIANAIRNRLSHETVRDTGCSLKVMRASFCKRLPIFRGMHRFLPTLMKMQGASVAEIKVNHRPRRSGVSKYGVWDRALSGLCDLLAVRWMQSRNIRYNVKERG